MSKIASVKNEVKLRQWEEMVQCRTESGLTVTDWCTENGINIKTYYYRLRRVREAMCSDVKTHEIVPITPEPEPEESNDRIEIIVGKARIIVPDKFNSETLRQVIEVLR